MLYNIMPENLYPKLPSAPSISQGSFNVEMVYYQDITDLKNKYNEKQRKYKNSYNKLQTTTCINRRKFCWCN